MAWTLISRSRQTRSGNPTGESLSPVLPPPMTQRSGTVQEGVKKVTLGRAPSFDMWRKADAASTRTASCIGKKRLQKLLADPANPRARRLPRRLPPPLSALSECPSERIRPCRCSSDGKCRQASQTRRRLHHFRLRRSEHSLNCRMDRRVVSVSGVMKEALDAWRLEQHRIDTDAIVKPLYGLWSVSI